MDTYNEQISSGPGTELKKMVPDTCKAYVAKMDRWGVIDCERRFDEIVDFHVSRARRHTSKHLKFVDKNTAAYWVQKSIDNAKTNDEVNSESYQSPEVKRFLASKPQLTTSPSEDLGGLVLKLYPWMEYEGCTCRDRIETINNWGITTFSLKRDLIVKWVLEGAKKNNIELSHEEVSTTLLTTIKEKQVSTEMWPFVWTYWAAGAKGDELKYSIRSVLRWYPNAKITIIGDKPKWYNGPFISSPRINRQPFQAFLDCYTKLQRATEHFEQFIWMMDDVYWVKDFPLAEAYTPKYVRHVSQQRYHNWKPKNTWAKTRARAYEWLLANNYPTYDFAGHLPQPIVSKTFQEMERRVNILGNYRNWECIYFNMFYAKDAIDYGRLFTRIAKRPTTFTPKHSLMNHTDSCFRGTIETYLSSNFSEPCQYEN